MLYTLQNIYHKQTNIRVFTFICKLKCAESLAYSVVIHRRYFRIQKRISFILKEATAGKSILMSIVLYLNFFVNNKGKSFYCVI